jgi:HSP20 family protein
VLLHRCPPCDKWTLSSLLSVCLDRRGQKIAYEIPGAGKENIHVNIEGSVVTIRAEISQVDTQNKDDKILRSERYYGEVSRSFQLPVDIDEASSKARYDNGVLTLNLLKRQKQGGQRMAIE